MEKACLTDNDLMPPGPRAGGHCRIRPGMSEAGLAVKRVADIVLSAAAIALSLPLWIACAIAIKHEDGGPVIFRQERIGRNGRPFTIYKFRTMRTDAESEGIRLSGDADPRVTRTGRLLRARHLDELPQLCNILRGDMSFVGPRPERRYYIDRILERDPRYTELYRLRPGATSYATLHNGYTDTMEKMLHRLDLDISYLRHGSLALDFRIMAQTLACLMAGKRF